MSERYYDDKCEDCDGLIARPNCNYSYSGLFCGCGGEAKERPFSPAKEFTSAHDAPPATRDALVAEFKRLKKMEIVDSTDEGFIANAYEPPYWWKIEEWLSAALSRLERETWQKALSVLREASEAAAKRPYDGNSLESACRHHSIAAESWTEIIRLEGGMHQAYSEAIEAVTSAALRDGHDLAKPE